MKIKFTKMHGLGNDFMVVSNLSEKIKFTPQVVRKLASRHFGIGFDQLLVVEPANLPDIDFFYRIFNANGQESGQCGNGARCLAQFIHAEQLSPQFVLRIATTHSQMQIEILDDGQIKVNMGIPEFSPQQIPLRSDIKQLRYQLKVDDTEVEFFALSMGNPHAVILVNSVQTAEVTKIGTLFNQHEFFPVGVNVSFMQVLNRQTFKLRVFERGVGETLACGSGACASHVVGVLAQMLDASANAHLPGGVLQMDWNGGKQPVFLIGPAQIVYTGEIDLSILE